MRKLLLIIAVFCTLIASAQDVIALRDGSRIEDVIVKSVTDAEITYTKDGETLTIPHNSAEAILYDDGRFETITPTIVEDNVPKTDDNLGDNATESQVVAQNNYDTNALLFQDKSYPANCRKEGYKAYYKVFNERYKPIFNDAKKSGFSTTEAMQYAMNEVLPVAMKAGNDAVIACNEGITSATSSAAGTTMEAATSNKKSKDTTQTSSPSQKMIPQICYTEGKNAYDAVYKEGQIQAVRRGYSKTQAILIAGEFAEQAKKKAIDDCYETIVVRDEELSQDTIETQNGVSFFERYPLSASAKQIIPQACVDEGKKAYDAAYAEAEAKALRQGYSKSQAKTLANDVAEKARKKAIDECYDKVVNHGQDFYSNEEFAALDTKAQETKAKEEAKAQEAQRKEEAKAREAEEKRLAEDRKKHEADSIKAAKEAIALEKKNKSAIKERRMFLGLSLGGNVPFTQWNKSGREYVYNEYTHTRDFKAYTTDGEGIGPDIQFSFDFAYPISSKFAMGLYVSGGGGISLEKGVAVNNGERSVYDRTRSIWKITGGLLMTIGDFTQKGACVLGVGVGGCDAATLGMIVPLEFRLGGLFKNGFYFTVDVNMSPLNVTLYDAFYIEPGIKLGYNFGNLFSVK